MNLRPENPTPSPSEEGTICHAGVLQFPSSEGLGVGLRGCR
jgi:hypothetical protein